MPPFVSLVGVIKEEMAGQLPAKVEGSRSLAQVLGPVQLGLDDVIPGAPRVAEVDKFHIHGLKAVLLSCGKRKKNSPVGSRIEVRIIYDRVKGAFAWVGVNE